MKKKYNLTVGSCGKLYLPALKYLPSSDLQGTLSDHILPYPFKCHEEVLSLQPMIPPKRFDIFPLN